MRKANGKTVDRLIHKRLAEVHMSERERERAARALGDAEAIVDAIVWVRQRVASLGAFLLRPGFKH